MHNDGSKPGLGSKFLYWMGGLLSGFFGMFALFYVVLRVFNL